MRTWLPFGAAVIAVSIVGGCNCETTTQQRFPEINVDPTALDFGAVQVGQQGELPITIYNSGAATLNVFEFRLPEPFTVKEEAPVTVSPGTEVTLTVVYTPTVDDKRDTGTLILASDDPEKNEVEVRLNGFGITALASASPSPLDFGDVWVEESKTLTLTITNAGINELTVLGAQFLPGTPAAISADLGPISQNIPGGGVAETEVTYAPTAMSNEIPGGIRLELDPNQGGELIVPFAGRGVQALPRICFKLDDDPMEQCTAVNAGSGFGTTINVDFPPLCDELVSPPDAGTNDLICAGAPYEMSGRFYIRNEGNIPVQYSLKYRAVTTSTSCDGGVPQTADFHFSNQPDGGALVWDEATTQLPAMATDPRPWETAPVTLTYRPTARCPAEATDSARVEWTRQGDNRDPVALFNFLAGQSRLPQAKEEPRNINGFAGTVTDLFGAGNRGNAGFQITRVRLFEVVSGVQGGNCMGPDAGFFQECQPVPDPLSDCAQFAWTDGGNPNLAAPHTVPASDGGTATTVKIGEIEFGPNPGNLPQFNQPYCVYSVVDTTDPFHPEVVSKIEAVRTN